MSTNLEAILNKANEIKDNTEKVFKSGQLNVVSSAKCLKGDVSGEVVLVDDVSEIDDNINVRLNNHIIAEGKGWCYDDVNSELFQPLTFEGVKACSITTSDGVVAAGSIFIIVNNTLICGIANDNSEENPEYYPFIPHYNCIIDGTTLAVTGYVTNKDTNEKLYDINETFEVPKNALITGVGTHYEGKNTYIVRETVKVIRTGKNLVDQSVFDGYNTNGLKITYDAVNDCLVLNTDEKGVTNSGNIKMKMNVVGIPGKTYCASAKYLGGEITRKGYAIVYFGTPAGNWFSTANMDKSNVSGVGTLPSGINKISNVWFFVEVGTTFKDYRIRIQLEENTSATEYEKYTATEYTPNADGTAKILCNKDNEGKNIYTKLYTNTEGVTITANYIKDINKTFNALKTNISLSGGN